MPIETLLTPEHIDQYTRSGFWANTLLTDFLDAAVRRNPDKVVVVDRWGRLTYGRLGELADRLAHGLAARGIGPEDIVVLQLPNWHHVVILHLALLRIGAITVNVPTTLRQHELAYLLNFTQAKAMVIPAKFRDFDHSEMLDQLRSQLPHLESAVVIDGMSRSGTVSYEELIETAWERRDDRIDLSRLRPDPNAVIHIGFTSGTTGEPKGAMHTSNTMGAMVSSVRTAFNLTENDVVYMPSPVGHHLGFWMSIHLAIGIGGSIVYSERWVPSEGVGVMANEAATFMAGSTTFLHDLVYSPELDHHGHLPALRVYIAGGAPVPPKLLADAHDRLPHTFVTAAFGMTENGPAAAVTPTCPPNKVLETNGRAYRGVEFRVVGADGAELPRGTDGELEIRAPQQSIGYFQRPDLNAELYRGDGFFRTGDQASMDAEGYIRITGRIKDLIIRGGENVAPADIEAALAGHPKIAAISVIGMPDQRLGERICAYVVTRDGAPVALDDVTQWLAERGMAKKKWPERLEIVDSFPTTPAGKIQKFVLRQWLAEKMNREKIAEAAHLDAQPR